MTPKFLSPLKLQLLSESYNENPQWMLLADLLYDSALLDGRVTVPQGFVTDLASVPRQLPVAYALFAFTGNQAAVVHDHLYQTHAFVTGKDQADAVFREALEALGMPLWRRDAMFQGVQVGGERAWDTGPERLKVLNPALWTRSDYGKV